MAKKNDAKANVYISIHDPEIRAMAAIKKVIQPLYSYTQERVLAWAVERFLDNMIIAPKQ